MSDDFQSLHVQALDPERSHLPLMLLDIDGVINAYGYRPGETDLPDGAYRDLTEFSVNVADGRAFRFWTSPTLVAEIVALHESDTVEIGWLTTWQHQANVCAATVLGLPQFPVVADQGGRFSDYYWKPRAAVEALRLQRSVIWVDDAEVGPAEHAAFHQSGLPSLIIEPNPRVGLTATDMQRIRDFLAENA